MSRDQIISDAVASIQSGQLQVLQQVIGQAVDQSAQEQKASDGTLTQGDLDAAVKAATDPLNAQIAALTAQDQADIQAGQDALAKAQADSQAALSALQAQFDTLSAKESQEAGVISGLQGALSQLQGVVSVLQGLVVPTVPVTPSP